MDDKLTHKSQDALSVAVRHAAADGSPQVDPLHLLLALLEQADGTTAPLLRAVGADPALVAKQAEERLARLPRARGATLSAPEMSRPLLSAIATASSRAKQLNDEYISTEHLLVGLAADGGEAKAVLAAAGATPDALLEAFSQIRGSARVTSQDPEDTYKALEKFGIDLTGQARDGKLDPVVGAGAAEGAMDAGNMLKPMLARGELRMVGATTLDEYRERIEKDPALERRGPG